MTPKPETTREIAKEAADKILRAIHPYDFTSTTDYIDERIIIVSAIEAALEERGFSYLQEVLDKDGLTFGGLPVWEKCSIHVGWWQPGVLSTRQCPKCEISEARRKGAEEGAKAATNKFAQTGFGMVTSAQLREARQAGRQDAAKWHDEQATLAGERGAESLSRGWHSSAYWETQKHLHEIAALTIRALPLDVAGEEERG